MEAKHVIVIQRNHKFLKELLIVEPVLDALLQDGVFTQEDYDNCRQAGPGKCEMLLEILKKKGVEGYRTLCGVLDSTQPFIKERLDATSLEGGNSDLVFVNKLKVQSEHRKELAGKDEQIAELQSGMEDLTKQLEDKQKDYDTLEETNKKHREELMSQMDKQKEEIETLTTKLSESNQEVEQCQKQRDELKLRLQAEQEAYELLSGLPTSQSSDREVMTEADQQPDPAEGSSMCKLSTVPDCDDKQLYLLSCLHSVCKPCIDHHAVQTNQTSIKCPCGLEFRLEDTVADHVGRNKTAYAARSDGEKKCDYLEEDHDVQAAWHCHDCDGYLCSQCRKLHNNVKRNRGHSMDEVGQADAIPMKQWLKEPYCKDHPSNELQLYDHTCKKAICIVCRLGDHEHHKNEDLSRSHEKAKLQLEEQLQKQRLKLKDVKDTIGTVNSHKEELDNKQRKLEEEVIAVSKRVAVKFLHRQKKLREEIQMALDNTNKVVQENLDSLHDVQSSIISTIDYTQRTLESTRREELITLTATIQEKCDENLKRELPEDDKRDTSILLSFQGQTALEELIDTFGGLASSLQLDHIPDSQPTLQGLHSQNNLLTVNNKVHEGRWHHLEQILHHVTGPASSAEGSPEPFTSILTTQGVYEAVANVLAASSITVYFVGDSNVISVICPKLQLSADRANTDWCHVTTAGQLVNSPPATQHRHSGRLRKYRVHVPPPHPLPPSPLYCHPIPHTPRYWETHSRVGVVGGGLWWYLVLEMGVGEESQVDSERYVYYQRRSWCVSVGRCLTHQGSLCTSVWQQGEAGEVLQ
ncbi:uncharacterized protein LOC124285667 isoform X2 [Haliotis rubra]|uniref:uncharacterized protein LOC124285667 isoform X2 n=1 Tax=Haliotis rubra TaxID=36100 RepID=UPI001EE5E40F|nr:uncharacterized protein LOC124285667 isoform X2 [Haliotis rubra]